MRGTVGSELVEKLQQTSVGEAAGDVEDLLAGLRAAGHRGLLSLAKGTGLASAQLRPDVLLFETAQRVRLRAVLGKAARKQHAKVVRVERVRAQQFPDHIVAVGPAAEGAGGTVEACQEGRRAACKLPSPPLSRRHDCAIQAPTRSTSCCVETLPKNYVLERSISSSPHMTPSCFRCLAGRAYADQFGSEAAADAVF